MNIRIANRCIGCNVVVSRNSPYCFSCLNELKEKAGAMEEEIITEKVKVARNLYELSVEEFRINQSAHNYNMLILAMVSLQYWNQKRVRFFSTSEDF